MLETLLNDLNSRKESTRKAALELARELPPELQIELAEMEAREYRRRKRILMVAGSVQAITRIGFVIGVMHYAMYYEGNFPLVGICFAINFLAYYYTPQISRRSVAQLIEQTDDPRMIGPALTLLSQHDDADVGKIATRTLIRLLPKMRADQGEMLTAEQRQALLIPLKWPYDNIPLTLAVLKALEQVGDEKAIPLVDRLAKEISTNLFTRHAQKAAIACLPYLKQKAKQSRQAQTLLRPANVFIAVEPDALLRSAAAHADSTLPEQMLRPSHKEDRTHDAENTVA